MNRRPKGEGSIFQRPDGRWVGRLTYEDPATGLRKQTQVSASSKKAVSERLRALQDRVKTGAPPRDDKALFGAFAEQWVSTTLAVSNRRQSTKSLYASLTRSHLVGSHLGNLPMDRVTPTAVERWLTELRKRGLAESTVRTTYTVARAIGDAAVRDHLIVRNPFAAIKRPKVEQAEAAHLTVEQFRALQSSLADSRYALLVELLGHTGLRRGEALALQWRDVDLDEQVVRVRGTLARVDGGLVVTAPKSKKSLRSVPLTDAAVGVLRRVKRRTAEDRLRAGSKWVTTGFVFVTEFGEPCDPRNALRALQSAAQAAGLPKEVGLHTIRHTAATVMLENGVPMKVVSEILGHAGISITADIYSHVRPASLAAP